MPLQYDGIPKRVKIPLVLISNTFHTDLYEIHLAFEATFKLLEFLKYEEPDVITLGFQIKLMN
jgi:hypothetical protein